MHELTESELAELLPGTWRVAATNLPGWLSGERRQPQYTYSLVSASPLTLTDEVSFVTTEGETQTITGKSVFKRGEFQRNGTGLKMLARSRWHVRATDEARSLVVLRIDKTLATPAGIEVAIREGSSYPQLRRIVASSTEALALSPEDFASLGWLGV